MRKAIGISPMIDMAFKKTFGTPENKVALISLLNAILKLLIPIVDVEIINPYNLQDFETDKLSILDIKARDRAGTIYHIEMQLTMFTGLIQRVVFYGCELYAGQLKSGQDYTELAPVYSICLVDGILWKDANKVHQRFRLCDLETGLVLEETLQIHTLELGRYTLTEADLKAASVEDCWLFWLLHAHEYEPEELLKLFPEEAFQQATRAIIQIAEKTEDKSMYDAREKANRDFQSAINSALREGRLEGELKGKLEGKLEGERIGKIHALQEILGVPRITDEELRLMSLEELAALAFELQQSVRSRLSP
jgi:predicted transposase/invertase (TIGR01784 family)